MGGVRSHGLGLARAVEVQHDGVGPVACRRRTYGLWSMVYGLWSMVYGLWSTVYGLVQHDGVGPLACRRRSESLIRVIDPSR